VDTPRNPGDGLSSTSRPPTFVGTRPQQPSNLADVLERVLDKGIVIVGDIQVRLLDIELLTIKIRLMVASVDRAREMGINWWEGDPFVNTLAAESEDRSRQEQQTIEMQRRLEALEQRLAEATGSQQQALPEGRDRDG
jgi:hypothetical protein